VQTSERARGARVSKGVRTALLVTLALLMTAAWIFVLGAGAVWLIDGAF